MTMTLKGTTPVPNFFFDKRMVDLSSSAIRVYLKIIRNTLGWRDSEGNTKKRDWISHSQFSYVGVSSRSVTTAVQELLNYGLIRVSDEHSNNLSDPQKRKQAKRIYYAPVIPNLEKTTDYKAKPYKRPLQKFRTTKEISTKEYKANQRIPDHVRMREILQHEEGKQQKRDNWY